jgi:hypothetical protein
MSTTDSKRSTRTAGGPQTPPSGCPSGQRTHLGPIAESYDQLHRIDLLTEAIGRRGVPQASYLAATCAILQASEVCLMNIARLADRTRHHLLRDDTRTASINVQWMGGFHRLMRELGGSMFAIRSIFGPDPCDQQSRTSISETAGYRTFVGSLENLEDCLKSEVLSRRGPEVRTTLATQHLDDELFRLLHGLRISYHDATKWESDLSDIALPVDVDLEELLSSPMLAEAVAATELNPGTFHGEFVALHQIPEILCAEVNDHLEAAVRTLRNNELSRTVEHLSTCRALLVAVLDAQRVMAELLATCEYHEFRENLGAASGIHSLAIKQHMFGDLFKHFWAGIETWLGSLGALSLEDSVRELDEHRHDDTDSWLRHSVLDESFRLHSAHQNWRHEHLHMPRNCLGSGGTKSMIGIPDGPRAVHKMRDAANADSALVAIHDARQVKLTNIVPDSPLARLLTDHDSVDAQIMRVVGEVTRDYFPEVQQQSYQPFQSTAPERKP